MSAGTLPAPVPTRPDPTPPRSNLWVRRLTPPLLLLAGAALGVGGVVFMNPQLHTSPPPASEPDKVKEQDEPGVVAFPRSKWEAAGVRTEVVAPSSLEDHAWRSGRVVVDDDRVAHVSPPVEGILVEVKVKLGQDVQAGAVLAVMESREVGQAKLDLITTRLAAEAEKERAGWAASTAANTADLVKAVIAGKTAVEIEAAFKDRPVGERRHTLMAAYSQRNHLRTLLEGQRASSAVVAGSLLKKTESDTEAAEASLRALCEEFRFQAAQQARQAELKLKEATVAYDAARTHLFTLGYTREQVDTMDPVAEGAAVARFEVTAPFAGTVVEKHAVRSERVGPLFQLFQIADLSSVWIQADAFEADLPIIRRLEGRGLVFRAASAGVEQQPAEVVYTGDLVDKVSRALTVTATAKNPGRVLKPGMYVEVGLPRGTSESIIHVPASAVQRHQGKVFVFVHDKEKEGEFHRVDVVLGREGGERVEVRAGLKAGDEVAVGGGFVLKSELFRDQLAGD